MQSPEEGVRACHSPGLGSPEVWAPRGLKLFSQCHRMVSGVAGNVCFSPFLLHSFSPAAPLWPTAPGLALTTLLSVTWGGCQAPAEGGRTIVLQQLWLGKLHDLGPQKGQHSSVLQSGSVSLLAAQPPSKERVTAPFAPNV